MTGRLFNFDGDRFIERFEGEPECGEDFCDQCGDCLACYGGDPCEDGESGHNWIRYAEPEDGAHISHTSIQSEPVANN